MPLYLLPTAPYMDEPDFKSILGPALAGALEQRGFARLTPVQEAVLDPELAGRDLRITSQTGSGKTVAIGFALRDIVESASARHGGPARPRALVVAPTRELAKQVEAELTWLYAPLHAKVASATGGASYQDERRALSSGPAIVVGTPGRLLDHLGRGAIDAAEVGAIVFDEADRMLDLGFREDLEAIIGHLPEVHRTHLISATFPRAVKALADQVQSDPVHVEGTPLGAANADIDHVVMVVDPRQRLDAVVNLLLAHPEKQTLCFARTRADVAHIARDLHLAGFAVSSISGEMEQPARNRALADFKRGNLRVLVATDVAARGIDVQDIALVIHADPPDDPDTYTHRSGRTGRAGRKGQSTVLTSPSAVTKTTILLRRAKVTFRFESVPTPEQINSAGDERLYGELMAPDPEDFAGHDEQLWAFAKRLASETEQVTRTIARLLARGTYAGPTEPREIRTFDKPAERGRGPKEGRDGRGGRSFDRGGDRGYPRNEGRSFDRNPRSFESRGGSEFPGEARRDRGAPSEFPREPRAPRGPRPNSGDFVPFRVSWGADQGADPRRLMAMVCRRGDIRGADVGHIRLATGYSIVEVASSVAETFATAASAPDPRNPKVWIRRESGQSEGSGEAREHRSSGSRDFAPRDAAPRDAAPRDTAPRDTAPRDTAPSDPDERPTGGYAQSETRPRPERRFSAERGPRMTERRPTEHRERAPAERTVESSGRTAGGTEYRKRPAREHAAPPRDNGPPRGNASFARGDRPAPGGYRKSFGDSRPSDARPARTGYPKKGGPTKRKG